MNTTDNILRSALSEGAPIIITLHTPREKMWGVLGDITTAGVFLLGIDLNTFDDWLRMVMRGEHSIDLNHVFFPMWRVERVILDQTLDEIPSLSDRFYQTTGYTVGQYLGLEEVPQPNET